MEQARTVSLVDACHPTDTIEIHPDDASALRIVDGGAIRVTSRYGRATLSAQVTERVEPGVVFCTFSDPRLEVNRLTGPHRDRRTHTPRVQGDRRADRSRRRIWRWRVTTPNQGPAAVSGRASCRLPTPGTS